MKMFSRFLGAVVASSFVCGLWCTPALRAHEPAAEFLQALRERGYHDIAIEYLEVAKSSPAVPVAFKKTYLLEKGVTLVEGARLQRDQALREKQLNEAHQTLTQFVTEQPDAVMAINARQQLGTVIVERARMRMEKAKKLESKTALHTEARNFFTEAVKVFTELEGEVREKLEQFPKNLDSKKDKDKYERREQLRADYLQSQLLVPLTQEETSETYPKGNPEAVKLLTEAGKNYAAFYEKYRTRIAGLYARLYQARTLQKLDKHKEAIAFVTNDLLVQPDAPDAFRNLKVQATILGLPSWDALGQQAEGVAKGLALIDSARPAETKSREFMELRFLTAKISKSYADELKKKDPKSKEVNRVMLEGKKMLQYVIKFPNEFQDDARKLFPSFAPVGDTAQGPQRVEPKTFAEAKQLGQEAVEEMQSANLSVKALSEKLPSAAAADKAEMQKQLAEATKKANDFKDDALYYFTTAQKYIAKDTPADDVNVIRYLMCYLKFVDGNYYDAVVLGEFVCRRYPAAAGARQCAKIALASYLKLFSENKTDDKSFESERVVEIADYIVQKWPDQPEAEEALNTLIPFMIKEGQLDRAQSYLDKISKESKHRGTAELKTGQALWGSYLNGAKEIREWEAGEGNAPAGVDLAKKKADLEKLKTRAQQTLVDGVTRMQQGSEVTPVVVTAALSLAQIYVDTNQPGKAVALLEDKKIGPLVLLESKHETMSKAGLPEETYKTALRAYISSLSVAGSGKADDSVAKAQKIMTGLKSSMGSTPEGQKRLIATYVGLARDLQTQMQNSPPEVRAALGKGFEAFLEQVGKEATELNVLNWVGETYRGMGESFMDKGVATTETKKYLGLANATFKRILDMGAKDAKFLPSGMDAQIRLQMAKTMKQMGDYKEAMDLFEEVLKKQNSLLPVQIEAAKTYQDWAAVWAKQKPETALDYYKSAVFGARPDKDNKDKAKAGKNVIWGWGQISQMTASNPKFNDQFHEARYNLSLCRYKKAQLMKEKKDEELKRVKSDIAILVKVYPTLGGDKWRGNFDKLLKDVQMQLKENPIGLKEYETATPAAAPGTPPGTTPPATPAAPTASAAPAAVPVAAK